MTLCAVFGIRAFEVAFLFGRGQPSVFGSDAFSERLPTKMTRLRIESDGQVVIILGRL